ncbi:DUF4870 domain-containing protein [Bacillus sp. M6-12]|uniref:DUF4870 domain-containing protein n=1 Tax=Bacillus sp. M6-12 TaxID=2054166 RepID=UPI000C7793E3|nr:DUF4870 domain-containing protein [Bacillus sp. M6-12]PLS17081.1 DUF4870 domain-containing protein [Bacillus sp. M6-12]
MADQNEKLLAAAIYVVSFFTAFIGPLVIWLIKKNESAYIDYHGREYLNFLISYSLYGFVGGMLTLIFIGWLILPAVALLGFIFTIIGAVKAAEGVKYRIPFVFRIL